MRQIAERGKDIFHPLGSAVHVNCLKSNFGNFDQVYVNVIYIYNTKYTSYKTTSHGESNGICLPYYM